MPVFIDLPEKNIKPKHNPWIISHDTVIQLIDKLIKKYIDQKKTLISLYNKPKKIYLPFGPLAFFHAEVQKSTTIYQRIYDNTGLQLSLKEAIFECEKIIQEYQKALNLFFKDNYCSYPSHSDEKKCNLIEQSLSTGKLISEEDLLNFWDQHSVEEQIEISDSEDIQYCNEYNQELEEQIYENYYSENAVQFAENDSDFNKFNIEDCFNTVLSNLNVFNYSFDNNSSSFKKVKSNRNKKVFKFNPYTPNKKNKFYKKFYSNAQCNKFYNYNVLAEYKQLIKDLYSLYNWNFADQLLSKDYNNFIAYSKDIVTSNSQLVYQNYHTSKLNHLEFGSRDKVSFPQNKSQILYPKDKIYPEFELSSQDIQNFSVVKDKENIEEYEEKGKSVVTENNVKESEKKLNPAQLKIIQLINSKSRSKNKTKTIPQPKIMAESYVLRNKNIVTYKQFEIVCSHDTDCCRPNTNYEDRTRKKSGDFEKKTFEINPENKSDENFQSKNESLEFNAKLPYRHDSFENSSKNGGRKIEEKELEIGSKTLNVKEYNEENFENNTNEILCRTDSFNSIQKLEGKAIFSAQDTEVQQNDLVRQISKQQLNLVEQLHNDFLKSLQKDTTVYYNSSQHASPFVSNIADKKSEISLQEEIKTFDNNDNNGNLKDILLGKNASYLSNTAKISKKILLVEEIEKQLKGKNEQFKNGEKEKKNCALQQNNLKSKILDKAKKIEVVENKYNENGKEIPKKDFCFKQKNENVSQKHNFNEINIKNENTRQQFNKQFIQSNEDIEIANSCDVKNKLEGKKSSKNLKFKDNEKKTMLKSENCKKNDENCNDIGLTTEKSCNKKFNEKIEKSIIKDEKNLKSKTSLNNKKQDKIKKKSEINRHVNLLKEPTILSSEKNNIQDINQRNIHKSNQTDTNPIHSRKKEKQSKRKVNNRKTKKDGVFEKDIFSKNDKIENELEKKSHENVGNHCNQNEQDIIDHLYAKSKLDINIDNVIANKTKIRNKINDIKQRNMENNEKYKMQYKRVEQKTKSDKSFKNSVLNYQSPLIDKFDLSSYFVIVDTSCNKMLFSLMV